ncbi:SRPBCC family protein [Aequorivita echinoideorum]|uniref:SRPBCC family protein n=1 Tax=Aequorivita echinoideorum TaxID=1549647 RepID=A0ABS5S4Z5_9FLAO|nr:SRPBCC family protein [Aequorivita echinoideorum]MBT0608285.1 SRPBCC family protein [Aequorivita echinoideorum]
MKNNSVSLHRILPVPPEKLFKAFTDADAMAAWIPPYGFLCKVHNMDATIGGKYKMSFTNFSTGSSHSFGGEYLEIVPNELIKYTDQFDDENLPGKMITTVKFKKVSCGTELNITQEGIPEAIPAELCYLGWQESLDKLKRLVEPSIPDAPEV